MLAMGSLLLWSLCFFLLFWEDVSWSQTLFVSPFCLVVLVPPLEELYLEDTWDLSQIQIPALKKPRNRLIFTAKLFSPLGQPLVFLKLCLFLGAIHMILGITLNGIKSFIRGDKMILFLESIPWVMILGGLIMYGFSGDLNQLIGAPVFVASVFKYTAIIGVGLLLLGHLILEIAAGKGVIKINASGSGDRRAQAFWYYGIYH